MSCAGARGEAGEQRDGTARHPADSSAADNPVRYERWYLGSSMTDSHLSRRTFLARTGVGGVLLMLPPWLRLPLDRHFTPATYPAAVPASLFSGLEWRMLGPFRGGRVDAVCGVPGRPEEFYFGHVNGGVWKTIDAGRVWSPVFDSQPVASIGALAVAPSAPEVIYVGSGESTLRDSTGYGNGVYKSNDAGKTWTHSGLDDTQHIGKIAVHPANPDIVFVAAIGHYYGPSSGRGVFGLQTPATAVARACEAPPLGTLRTPTT
jgi:hypothetical protein